MAKLSMIHSDQYNRSSWKNGLGFTDQIAIYPEHSDLKKGDFIWRISSAQIDRDSDFSIFHNHDRVLILLKGNGLRLKHQFEGESEEVQLGVLEPYDFPGDIQSRCELNDGSVVDLSIFIKKGEVEIETKVVDLSDVEHFDWRPEGHVNFAFAAQGCFSVQTNITDFQTDIFERSTVRLDLDRTLDSDKWIRLSSKTLIDKNEDQSCDKKISQHIVLISLTLGG